MGSQAATPGDCSSWARLSPRGEKAGEKGTSTQVHQTTGDKKAHSAHIKGNTRQREAAAEEQDSRIQNQIHKCSTEETSVCYWPTPFIFPTTPGLALIPDRTLTQFGMETNQKQTGPRAKKKEKNQDIGNFFHGPTSTWQQHAEARFECRDVNGGCAFASQQPNPG